MSRYLYVPVLALSCFVGMACDFPLTGVSILEDPRPGFHPEAGPDDPSDASPDTGHEGSDSGPDGDAAPDGATSPPCFEGDLTIEDGQESAYASLTCIQGKLSLVTDEAVALPALREVTGDIEVWSGPATISLPVLETAGGLAVRASALKHLELPALTQVTDLLMIASPGEVDAPKLRTVGRMAVEGVSAATLALPLLTRVAGNVTIHGERVFHALSFPSLTEVDGTFQVYATALSTLDLPVLRKVKGLLLEALSPELLGLHFSQLEQVDTLSVGTGPTVPNGLRTLTFAILTKAGDITIRGPDLLTVELPMLTECASLQVIGPKLADLNVYLLQKVAGSVLASSNAALSWRFPTLEEVGAMTLEGTGAVNSINLSSLRAVTAYLRFRSMPGLAYLYMPVLLSATEVEVSDLPDLQSISMPIFSAQARVFIMRVPRLTQLNLDEASTLKSLHLDDADLLESLTVPELASVEYVNVWASARFRSLSLPALTSLGSLHLYHLPALWSVAAGELGKLGTLDINDTSSLGYLDLTFPKLSRLTTLLVQSTQIAALRLPHVVDVDTVQLEFNAELATLELPALLHVRTEGLVGWSPKLPSCQVSGIDARLETGHLRGYELGPCQDAKP